MKDKSFTFTVCVASSTNCTRFTRGMRSMMAMEINGVYNNYADNVANTVKKEKQKAETAAASRTTAASQPQLSEKAQDLLEKLKKTYGNMDFMVADFEKGDDAKEILSRGTKEFSVLFSSRELEKMASDDKYLQEKLQGMEGAVRMSEQINEQFSFESASGKNANQSELKKIAIAFHDDGTTTFFAELEKSGEKQKERIEKAKESRSNRWSHAAAKQTTVQADSMEELLEKMNAVDWSKVSGEEKSAGKRFDFSI